MRFFMGVGKYTPYDAMAGDMGWKPPYIRQWSNVFRHWARCSIMEHGFLQLTNPMLYWLI
jgi:hypothetical protein